MGISLESDCYLVFFGGRLHHVESVNSEKEAIEAVKEGDEVARMVILVQHGGAWWKDVSEIVAHEIVCNTEQVSYPVLCFIDAKLGVHMGNVFRTRVDGVNYR